MTTFNKLMPSRERLVLAVITFAAFVTRLWNISHPDEVVFDEYHFGKFVNGYLTGKHFFDIHPPLGKLLLSAAAVLGGYNGTAEFSQIGQSIGAPEFVWVRIAAAVAGALIVPVAYITAAKIVEDVRGRILAGCLAAALITCDHLLLVESKLALTDSFLVLFTAISCAGVVHFLDERVDSPRWWRALFVAALGAGGAASVKWTAAALFPVMGIAALRQMLVCLPKFRMPAAKQPKKRVVDPSQRSVSEAAAVSGEAYQRRMRKTKSDEEETTADQQLLPTSVQQAARSINVTYEGAPHIPNYGRKFVKMLLILSVVPLTIYTVSFWLHFQLLPFHGPGDVYMSSVFQSTLIDADSTQLPAAELSFVAKFAELHQKMLSTNSAIKEDHPWGSKWWTWPFDARGVLYWQSNDIGTDGTRSYIVLFGNPFAWWFVIAASLVFVLKLFILPASGSRVEAYGKYMIGYWLLSWLPFIAISRVCFLYHYLLPYYFTVLLSVCCIFQMKPIEYKVASVALIALMVVGFFIWAPFAYGLPVTPAQLAMRKWLPSWW